MYLKTIASKSFLFTQRILTTQIRNKALDYSPNAQLNKAVLDKYMCLPIPECACQVEYVWIDGSGQHMRSRSRTFDFPISSHRDAPTWNCDGSECYFTENTKNAHVFLCPIAMYKDPMRRGKARIVLCDTYRHDHKPTESNHRSVCFQTVNECCEAEIMTGFHQQFFFMDMDARPYGWPKELGFPFPPGQYYCGVGSSRAYCRDIIEAHYRACLYAGIEHGGCHQQKNLSQWEFRLKAGPGIKSADDLWMARYLLLRIAEEFGVRISFKPQMFPDLKGSCCHTTFSTKNTRKDGGLKDIEEAIEKLNQKHEEHTPYFYPEFRGSFVGLLYGVEQRKFAIRIPKYVSEQKKGYFQDRRPRANSDPYRVVHMLTSTIVKGS